MPKEIIHSKHHDPGSPENAWDPFVKVGWNKEGDYVEVGVLHEGNITLDNQTDAPAGWFAQLDRTGINRLIRTLRQARDQAYGADA